MPSSRWSTEKQLSGILVDFLSHMPLFKFLIDLLPEYYDFWVYIFMGFIFVCISCVFLVIIFNSGLFGFCLSCLFSREREKERALSWEGWFWRSWGRGICNQNILCENLFSIENMSCQDLIGTYLPLMCLNFTLLDYMKCTSCRLVLRQHDMCKLELSERRKP